MRWPSDNLIDQLRRLRLCTKADVEACEPIVRRLCHDLPDFDSVWIDALVQRRTLTPWQSARLQSANPDAIVVDNIQLKDALGAHTLLGETTTGAVVVRDITGKHPQDINRQRESLDRLLSEIDETRSTAPDSICLPERAIATADHHPRLVSRFVAGWTADELITRGGRLPWQAVAEIGRQLLDGLHWLDFHGWTHGEIVLRNIRISSPGNATLVAPFVKQLQQPTVSITSAQTLKEVETTAPELVGTGRTADSRSELYSLGCVLWQLLTARSPFPSADPVGRLQQGQLREVTNVRQLVPECPEWLASQIYSLTRRSPELRPTSVAIASKEWSSRTNAGTSATRRLLKRLPDRSQRQQTVRPGVRSLRGSVSKAAAVVVMVPLFCLYAWQRGLIPGTLELRRTEPVQYTAESPAASSEPQQTVEAEPKVLPLPTPDAAGVVLLRSGKEYQAADLQFAGIMHIETDGERLATIHVASTAWHVKASHVDLSNVLIQVAEGVSPGPDYLLQIDSDVFSLRNCIIDHRRGSADGSGVVWKSSGTPAGVISAQNCVFRGRGYGLWLQGTPNRLQMNNVLLQQQAGGVRCDTSQSPLRLNLSRVTQVGGNAFLDLVPRNDYSGNLLVQIQCGESVLAPSAGLIRVAAPEALPLKNILVEFLLPERGNPTIVPPDVDPVLCFDRSLQQFVELDPSQIVSESLLIARPVFRGAGSQSPSGANDNFELLDFEGPKLNPIMPGIFLPELPDTDFALDPVAGDASELHNLQTPSRSAVAEE